MKKKIPVILLVITILCFLFPMGETQAESFAAEKMTAAVLVDGVPQSFPAYNINDNNYFKLRDIAYILDGTSRQFEVEWDEEENKIVLTTGQGYTAVGNELNKEIGSGERTAIQMDSEVYLDGKAIFLTAYKIDGNNYFKLRDLGANIDFGVDWNAGAKTIEISSGKGYEPDGEPVIGMHTSVYDDETAQMLIDSLPALSQQGINLVIAEVGYDYQYASHPELAAEYGLSFEYARAIAEAAKETGIKLVPEFPCLGHQSWAEDTGALLTVYPEFDETPGKYPNNEGIYCRSWCPLNEEVNPIVFDLMDELMEAFQADAIHVGLDEVFIIGDEDCPRCHGKDPGDLFAKQVNDLYQHFVVEEGVGMYMWSDRLLDGEAVGDVYSEWDASYNGTYTAIDQIPKDIVMCDWHYDNLEAYPSINYFADKGFSVLTASYNDTEAAENFIQATMEARKTNANVQGHLYTTWEDIENKELPDWEPMIRTIELLKEK